jgi:DNA-binding transcriptional regulator YhcF (GntR family)
MDFVLSRKGPATVHAQLLAQIEMKILAGEFTAARKLPSVRVLARQLKIHPNTVSGVYKTLGRNRWVQRERGSGLYVRRGTPSETTSRPELEEMLRSALRGALHLGLTPKEIRKGVERWLATPPPSHVVVLETNEETAVLLEAEVRSWVDVPVSTRLLEVALREGVPSNALAVTWPVHIETVRPSVAGALVALTLEIPADGLRLVKALPKGALVLVVSRSMRVLRYTRWVIDSTRGDDLIVNGHLLSEAAEWRAAAPAADVVFADALSVDALRRVAGRRVHEYRLLSEESRATIHQHLAFPIPALPEPRRPDRA